MWMALAGPECLAEVSGCCPGPSPPGATLPWKAASELVSGPHLTRIPDLSALICFNFPMSPDESSSGGTKICQFSISSCYRPDAISPCLGSSHCERTSAGLSQRPPPPPWPERFPTARGYS
ncbi:hypothetical protein E5288_WYG016227 [Bos mutus]|uniref:Uncharacterized protein n=1 Tax=Bos mutus TaxID=72004 RepID=A0A6B0RLY1_9CETA|nr:hypothetical protein [Bos mutus]